MSIGKAGDAHARECSPHGDKTGLGDHDEFSFFDQDLAR
jgi:hypothetical protein